MTDGRNSTPAPSPASWWWHRHDGWPLRLGCGVAGALALVVLSLALDGRLAAYAETLSPTTVAVGSWLSMLGLSGYMFATSAVLCLGSLATRSLLRTRRYDEALTALAERAACVFAVLCVSGLAAQTIKHLVGRARPQLFRTFGPYHFDVLSMKNSLASFPSGHSTTAFAMAVTLSMMAPRLRAVLVPLACCIGLSRIVVQAHYLSDVVGGALLGVASALAVISAFARRHVAFTERRPVTLLRDGAIRAALGLTR